MSALLALLAGRLALAAPDPAPAPAEPPAPEAGVPVRRIALIVGVNDGGPGRVQLRYAGSDARSLARVLAEVGGLKRSDEVVLLDPDVARLLAGFDDARARVERARAAGERVQFLFYYSGHADDRGILLGGAQVDYPRLRTLIHGVPAQVRLGLLDSCSSGAFVRLKGGRNRPPLATGDASVEGHAFLTASSAEEAAQESDRIGGSFFTHYLVSGLRGAADINRDRRVTLNEAYRFAFDETLASTETTLGRAQHPLYDIQLVGTGDLVMTDLRDTSALLEIHPNVGGRVYVRDGEGRLAAELYKGVGAGAVSLALEPGPYTVVVDDGTRLYRASVVVRRGAASELSPQGLAPVTPEATTRRGGLPTDPGLYRVIGFGFGFVYPVTTNHYREKQRKVINRFGLNLFLGRAARIEGGELALGGNWVDEDVSGIHLSGVANYVGGDVMGFQSTGGANVVRGSVYGVQGAIAGNVTRGDVRGVQAAGGINVLGGHIRGVQAAGGVNWARSAQGLQVGAINTTRRIRGAQLGVINVAGEADAQVGVISVSRKGGVFADVWTSDTAAVNVALKLRAKYTYSFFAAGLHPVGAGRGAMFGLGFGGHIPLRQGFYLDLDLSTHVAFPRFQFAELPGLLNTARLLFGYQITRRFAVWGGPSFNSYVDFGGERTRIGYGYVTARVPADPYTVRMWPGFAVGFQL